MFNQYFISTWWISKCFQAHKCFALIHKRWSSAENYLLLCFFTVMFILDLWKNGFFIFLIFLTRLIFLLFSKWFPHRWFHRYATCSHCSWYSWGSWGGQWDESSFLDISKVFDRVRHQDLIAKLKSIGVERNM